LFGFFFGSALATTAGQAATWDIVAAALVLLFTEMISRWRYSRRQQQQGGGIRASLWKDSLNAFKIGIAYSLYLEAFKLGS
jgi:hypothetical protein